MKLILLKCVSYEETPLWAIINDLDAYFYSLAQESSDLMYGLYNQDEVNFNIISILEDAGIMDKL